MSMTSGGFDVANAVISFVAMPSHGCVCTWTSAPVCARKRVLMASIVAAEKSSCMTQTVISSVRAARVTGAPIEQAAVASTVATLRARASA